jgi:hypothetical protein
VLTAVVVVRILGGIVLGVARRALAPAALGQLAVALARLLAIGLRAAGGRRRGNRRDRRWLRNDRVQRIRDISLPALPDVATMRLTTTESTVVAPAVGTLARTSKATVPRPR